MKKILMPFPLDDDYERDWNPKSGNDPIFDYKGKIVLDLGSDWGSTAQFFLEKGARKVIAVDFNSNYIEQLRENFKEDPRVVPICMEVTKAKDFEILFEKYRPQIVKIDIDGGERDFAQINKIALNIPEDYLIEVHYPYLLADFKKFFPKNGFTILNIIGKTAWIISLSKMEDRKKGVFLK